MLTPARIADALARVVSTTGDFAPLVLFFASFVEHVFPPFPGDLLVVLGAWYAVSGELSWPATLVSVTSGALAGAWLDYRIGAALGRRLDRRAAQRGGLTEARLARFEASYRRWGGWLLLANRFLPGVRAFLFLAAGASGIPLRRVLLLGGLSAAIWNAALLLAGAALAENLGEMVALFERYTRAASIALASCAVAAVAWLLLRRAMRAGR
ncbi:MAG TPA: DedA family protein [Anaeromyxobacteraceae bacterium]|nr:DedA family protein [Anaeromyxobacteraceae bacterium]